MAETSSKKGRVRRVRKKQTPSDAADAVNVDVTDTGASDDDASSGNEADVRETISEVASEPTSNLVEDMIEHVVDNVVDSVAAKARQQSSQGLKGLNRRELAAAKARQMRLKSAQAWLNQGKPSSAKQSLFELIASAPSSAEAAEAETLLLELAARYEANGKSRLALELYDELARYD
ncbi:MAG: hypothetical protein AAF708_07935 [Deinococcota bacterium]